jgi:hypothetical protein
MPEGKPVKDAGRIAYRMVFTATDTIARTDVAAVRAFAGRAAKT